MKKILGFMAVLVALALGTNVFAAAFTPGDVVVVRFGDGSQPVTNFGQTVFLDEYRTNDIATLAGGFTAPTPVQTIQMPTSWVGNQAPLICAPPGATEGQMTLSQDGRFLVLTGFGGTIGQLTNGVLGLLKATDTNSFDSSSTTNAVTEADIPRVVGLVDGNGHVYTSITITNVSENDDDIRSAASLDGTNVWLSGSENLVKFTTRGTPPPGLPLTQLIATQVCANTSLSPLRATGIFGNTLYVDRSTELASATNTSATYRGIVGGATNNYPVNPFGGSLPVVSIPTNFVPVNGVGPASAEGIAMFNLANANQGGAAPDTLYLADSSTNFPGESLNRGGGLLKYCYTNSAWVYQGEIGAEDAYGVAGYKSGQTVSLYITEGTNNTLYYYNDISGYGGNPQNNPDQGQSLSLFAYSPGNALLLNTRGIAVVPQGGDSGTLTGGPGITIGPPYGPYFRGPQGGPFNPSNGVTYSVANLSASSGSFTFHASGTLPVTITPSSMSLGAGASTPVTITLASGATSLVGGQSYTTAIALHSGNVGGPIVDTITATAVIDAFYVTPTTNFISQGEVGGPFTPSSTVYVLSNATPGALSFSAYLTNGVWASVSPASGSVPGFSSVNVTVSINANANTLTSQGSYDDTLVLSNATANTQINVSPEVILQVGFGIFDDFSTYQTGNVQGQDNWQGSTADINPVQILTIVDGTNCVGCLGGTNEYVVPGGCVNASGTSQQPFKYVSAGPLTNAMYVCATNVVDSTNVYVMCNVPTYAITGMLITFTNAPSANNYVFSQGSTFLAWNDAGIQQNGSGYSWTTELDQYQTGGGPEGGPVYNFGQQYQVYLVTDFVESNAWVFVNPGTSDFVSMLSTTTPAVYSNGEGPEDPCSAGDCIGNSAQGWESITMGQYSSCPGATQPGYFVTRVAASTNYVDVYNWLNPSSNSSPSSAFAAWQNAYFSGSGGTLSSSAAPGLDLYGTGMSNTNKFLAGFSGTNATAYLHVINIAKAVAGGGTNVTVTYLGASGDTTYSPGFSLRTNILEYSTGTGNGSYTNNFLPTGQTNFLGVGLSVNGGTGLGTVTNMTDTAVPASPTRYYRVRVLLP
jgi:hypothetical protein